MRRYLAMKNTGAETTMPGAKPGIDDR